MSTLPAWSTWPVSPPSDSTTPANGVGSCTTDFADSSSTTGWSIATSSPGCDEPRDDLGLGEALAEVGQDEVAAHQSSHSQVSSAASTRSGVGRWYSSSFGDGIRDVEPVMRSTGAARWWKFRSVTRAATSAP